MSKLISTFFYVGLLPLAPGTYGSAFALFTAYLIVMFLSLPSLIILSIFTFFIGTYHIHRYLAHKEETKDPPEIVIDEVVGQWVAICIPLVVFWNFNMLYILDSCYFWLLSFFLFRVFDIWKPWPISWADRQESALGVMLDDILAGCYSSALSILLIFFFVNY